MPKTWTAKVVMLASMNASSTLLKSTLPLAVNLKDSLTRATRSFTWISHSTSKHFDYTLQRSTVDDSGMVRSTCNIACLQLDPIPFQVAKNADRVTQLVKGLAPRDVDILVLPEMALTGYIFSDLNHIEPFLEDPYDNKEKSSPSLMLARHLASTLLCHVIIGFPYKPTDWKEMSKRHKDVSVAYDARPIDCQNANNGPVVHDDSLKNYNAALLVDRDGNLLHIFRKHFNFEDDKRWSQEGPGFETITLPGIGKICIAICMDLNSYNFQTPFETYELARYCQREKVDILVMSLAWLTSLDPANEVQEDNLEGGPLADTINGWATRLSPFLETSDSKSDFYFVACNRTGTEKAAKFAGSSCAMRFSRTSNEPCVSLLGAMSRKEGVKIFELPLKSSSSSS